MPVAVTSFFVKANPVIPFLLRDSDLQGGLRVVADSTFLGSLADNPSAISPGARITGMLVVTSDNMHVHQLDSDGIFIDRGVLGGGSGSAITNISAPLFIDSDGNLSIDPAHTLPADGNPGDLLRLDSARNPIWAPNDVSPGAGTRNTMSHTATALIPPGTHQDFLLPMGRSCLMVNVTVDVPQIQVEAYGDPSLGESNPYTFKSRAGHLSDDGSTLLSDGTIRYYRRYSVVSNTEDPVNDKIYWRFLNHSNLPVQPTLTVVFTVIE